MTQIIGIKPIKQLKNYCGPASLKIVLEKYGLKKSQVDDVMSKLETYIH